MHLHTKRTNINTQFGRPSLNNRCQQGATAIKPLSDIVIRMTPAVIKGGCAVIGEDTSCLHL